MGKINWKRVIGVTAAAVSTAFAATAVVAKLKKGDSVYENAPEEKNPLEGKKVVLVEDENDKENADGVKGHLEAVGEAQHDPGVYEKYVKRGLDVALSFGGLMVLSPALLGIALAIKIDDPGPVLFTQKRVGQNKQYYKLHKYRTMKMCTPHDVPTHMLDNPEQYITKVGKFLRAHSLDELPQMWDIFMGNMSVIGPRPGLWNQDLLTAERDKYGANDVKPGLTGWAQINGRDELEIPEKARLDGEYCEKLGFRMDAKIFLRSLGVFKGDETVVEGGTGERKKEAEAKDSKTKILVICQYYYPENFQVTPICEQLVEDGYDVTVLTGLPNYPSGIVPDDYKTGHRDEYINGVHVIRCFELGRKRGKVHLALNYLSFLCSALLKVNTIREEFDLVFVYQLSPVLMGLAGKKYARKHKVPLLLYCCDLWPESMKMYLDDEDSPIFRYVKHLSKSLYSSCDKIAGQSISFLPYLRETHNIDENKLVYIPAFADEAYLSADFEPEDENTVDFVFLGNLGIAQDLISVLQAVEKIKNVPNFKVHFVGDGICLADMKQYVADHHMEHCVEFYGRRPVEEMPAFYKIADACLVSLKADNQTGWTLPSKVQGYMAAGKPIIGMIDGSAKDVITESNCGICVSSGDIEGLSNAMKDFIEHKEKYSDCGANGRSYFVRNFSKQIVMAKIEHEIDELEIKKK